MKNLKSLTACTNARLNQAIKQSEDLNIMLVNQRNGLKKDQMPHIRETLADLTQAIHEYNAYWNTLETV